jgi:hypothetical protein
MGSLIASYLVAALVNAAVGGIWGYIAAIESATPTVPPLELREVGPSAITQFDAQEVRQTAQRSGNTLPLSTLFPLRGPLLDRAQIENFARDSRAAEQAGAFVPSVPVTRPLIGGAVHLEMPRMAPNGQFVRPKIVIGLASSEMKTWLRSQGIAAEQCMLPMLRARARLNQETREFSAGLTVYARCTFY